MTSAELIERAREHAASYDIPPALLQNPRLRTMALVLFHDKSSDHHTQVILDPETGERFLVSHSPLNDSEQFDG